MTNCRVRVDGGMMAPVWAAVGRFVGVGGYWDYRITRSVQFSVARATSAVRLETRRYRFFESVQVWR